MWKYINEKLMDFESCFSRKAAFRWFAIIIVGLMVRSENLGVTSIIRALGIAPRFYESLIHFFRAASWQIDQIRRKWIGIVARSGLTYRVQGSPVLIADGVKASKEARKMPCVKKLAQESENSAKPQYIFGHMFGAIGILLGNADKLFCTPLSMRIHDGNETIGQWADDPLAQDSHVVRVIREACRIASFIAPSILLLDRYFLTIPALQTLVSVEKEYGHSLLTIVTKAKKNVVAYEKPAARTGRGRPSKKGRALKLQTLFRSREREYKRATVTAYGKKTKVSFLCMNLLWGQSFYRELRFVMVKMDGVESILVSTDTTMPPETIIELYALRFKIESCFRELKQVVAGFAYHFWTAAMPRLNRFTSNDLLRQQLNNIKDDRQKAAIVNAFKAIEGFAMFSCITIGLLQMGALRFASQINGCAFRWLRTSSNKIPSEATTADFLRKTIFSDFYFPPDLGIVRFIKELQQFFPVKAVV
jgi:hypothetical protein